MSPITPLDREKIKSLAPKVLFILFWIAWGYAAIQFMNSSVNRFLHPDPTPSNPYDEWAIENDTSPYIVWGASLKDIVNEDCQGWTCNGKDLARRDSKIWQFIGKGKYGKAVFVFAKPMDTFVIASKEIMGFDTLSGTTLDNQKVTFGYLTDGTLATPFLDSGNMQLTFRFMSGQSFTEPCGIIDPSPDGDEVFSLTLGEGIMRWNFSKLHLGEKGHLLSDVYSLTSLSIISQPENKIGSNQRCP